MVICKRQTARDSTGHPPIADMIGEGIFVAADFRFRDDAALCGASWEMSGCVAIGPELTSALFRLQSYGCLD